jgi:hypothetical protein
LFYGLVYACFLLSINIVKAPMMTITIIIATTPYISVLFDAKPFNGVAVGAIVAEGAVARKAV